MMMYLIAAIVVLCLVIALVLLLPSSDKKQKKDAQYRFELFADGGRRITFGNPFNGFLVYGGAESGKTKSIGKPLQGICILSCWRLLHRLRLFSFLTRKPGIIHMLT